MTRDKTHPLAGDARARRGLTHLELVVVLAILVAIGGILVPLLPNFVHRSNIASCVVNIPEIDKMVQTYHNLYAAYPDRLDNLVEPTSGDPLSYVALGTVEDYGICYETHSLTAGEAAALEESGVTTLMNLIEDPGTDGDWNPTFWPYSDDLTDDPTSTAVADGTNVLKLTPEGAELMGLPGSDTSTYVVFGLNVPCTMFRKLAAEPAYHFADTPAEDPATYYMAFGVVFQVGNADGALGEAVYRGCLAFHDFGPSTAGMHTREWWGRMKDERNE
jgi:Tfp pilus assembly protein PilE